MLTSIGFPKQHFDRYFHNNSVLLQFILKDFFHVSEESQKLLKIVDKMKTNQSIVPVSKELELKLKDLSDHLKRLAGPSMEDPWQLPWHRDPGLLVRLQNYSHLFAQNTIEDRKLFFALQENFHKAWVGCTQTLDLIRVSIYYHFLGEKTTNIHQIRTNLSLLAKCIRNNTRLLIHTIYRYRKDENVIFFLVRHYHLWNELYNHRILTRLIRKIFPEGLNEVKNFLIRNYSKKGCDFLIPIIKKAILEMRT